MNNSFFIKNGLVLSLDAEGRTGYFNIAVKNGKITGIDYDQQGTELNEKDFLKSVPDAEVIDASDKIIMPGFLNASINSAFSLNKIFFKKCSFENISNNVPLRLVTKFLTTPSSKEILKQLFSINYIRSLRNGEIFVNETSPVITKDFYESYIVPNTLNKWKQYYSFVVFDNTLLNYLSRKAAKGESYAGKKESGPDGIISGYKPADDINNYSLSSLKKLIKTDNLKLYLEVSQSHNNVEALRNVFGKAFIEVLDDFNLLSSDTILFNPVFLTHREINKLKENRVNLIFSPSDFLKFSNKTFDPVEYFSAGINVMIGTGLQGKDILSELKIMSTLLHRYNFPYEKLIRLVTTNTAGAFGISNSTGSIEKGKSADLIFFTLNDVRNLLTLPEIDAEKLSEFIIEELSVKDISDVIIKGHALVMNGQESFKKDYISMADEIADKLYEEGKYFEFREKYLRRKRVKEVSLGRKEPEKNEMPDDIFDDNFDIDHARDDSDFRIIGKKFSSGSYGEPGIKDIQNDYNSKPDIIHNLSEISSMDEGFNLMGEEPESVEKETEIQKEKKRQVLENEHYPLFSDDTAFKVEKADKKEVEASGAENKKSPVAYKKDKLRFGFSDED